jgi:superfamily II DNA or RNA helicase
MMKKMSNGNLDYIDIEPNLAYRIGQDSTRNLKIVEEMRFFVEELRLKRIIVFAADLHHSRVLAALFNYNGWNAFCLDSKTDMNSRHKIVDDFKERNDKLMVICNYDLLTTGFDVPIIDGGIIARPTMSLVLYSQMVGRIIRGPRAGGTEYAHIATVKDVALWRGFEDSYGYWNDVWYDE